MALGRINFCKKNTKLYVFMIVMLLSAVFVKTYTMLMPAKIDPKSYALLLRTIAKGESSGNYNAYYGNPTNTEIKFTQMTIAEVQHWQDEYVKNGNPSSAVGKYQIIGPTLNGLIKELNLNRHQKFNRDVQDRMAITLLERRGSLEYINDKLSRKQFAANLAKEWAALPKMVGESPDKSYYDADGINKANISIDEVYRSLDKLEKI